MEFKRSQFLPISLSEAWKFFSSPHNLSKITPEELNLKIIGKFRESGIEQGDLIDYKVKPLLNIPMNWKTEITYVNAPHCFVDEQLKGPYRVWKHTHQFEEVAGGTMVYDHVIYELPFQPFSRLMLPIVKKKIQAIFDYREIQMNKVFSRNGAI